MLSFKKKSNTKLNRDIEAWEIIESGKAMTNYLVPYRRITAGNVMLNRTFISVWAGCPALAVTRAKVQLAKRGVYSYEILTQEVTVA
jgi:hypothetical protein